MYREYHFNFTRKNHPFLGLHGKIATLTDSARSLLKKHYSIGQGILLSVQRVYKVFIFSLELQRESQILYFLAGAPARIINPLFSRWSSSENHKSFINSLELFKGIGELTMR